MQVQIRNFVDHYEQDYNIDSDAENKAYHGDEFCYNGAAFCEDDLDKTFVVLVDNEFLEKAIMLLNTLIVSK